MFISLGQWLTALGDGLERRGGDRCHKEGPKEGRLRLGIPDFGHYIDKFIWTPRSHPRRFVTGPRGDVVFVFQP